MSKLDMVLREEIRRLARREFKAFAEPLLASNRRLREEVRALRSELAARTDRTKRATRVERVQQALAVEGDQPKRRWSGPRLRAWREKNALSGVKIAALLGVSSQTLYNWEMEKSKPDAATLAVIAGLRSLGKRDLREALAESGEKDS